jgi:DNA polymerase-3 subunit epsilon
MYEKFSPASDDYIFIDDAGKTGGLRAEDLSNLGDFADLWPQIEEFLGDLPLVANAASTYMRTLEMLWDEAGITAETRPFLCTQVLGRKLTELGSFNLGFYADKFGYELPEIANALDKAKATAAIMLGLAGLAKGESLEELVEHAKVQWGSISSEARISCQSIRTYDDGLSKADLEAMREGFAKDGFDESHPLFEKYVLLTGTLRKGTRNEVEALLAKVGAFPEINFTKKTNYLVVGYDKIEGILPGGKPTGKITKSIEARAKGQIVEVVDEETFLDLLES